MRILHGAVFVCGLGMVGAAAMMVPDGTGGSVSAAVGSYIEDEARDYREDGGETRGERRWGRLMDGLFSMNDGILRDANVDLMHALPAAPDGWSRRGFATLDGEFITGTAVRMTGLASTTTNSILVDFEQITDSANAARATYQQGDTMVALMMVADVDRLREVEALVHEGSYVATGPRAGGVAVLDGVQVVAEPRIEHNLLTDERRPASFGHYTIDLDGMLRIEAITNGTTQDAVSVIEGIDLAGLQAALPGLGEELAVAE